MRAYKDSGIEWLGEIPEHWEVVKIKHIAEIITGKTPTLDSEWGDNMFFITPTDCDLDKKYVSSSLRKLSQNGIKNFDSLVIPKNSILVTCIASIGKVAINLEEVITNQQINSVIPNADLVLPDFIFYQLCFFHLRALGRILQNIPLFFHGVPQRIGPFKVFCLAGLLTLLHHLQKLGSGLALFVHELAQLVGVQGDHGDLRGGEKRIDRNQNHL